MRKYGREKAPIVEAPTEVPKKEDGSDAEGYFTHPRGHIRDRIILHETRESYKEGQFVGLNGFPFLVQYNKELDLPRPVLEMLRTRIVTMVDKDIETGVETVRHLPRFNFTIVKENVNQKPNDEVGVFTCNVCDRNFTSKLGFLSHQRSHKKDAEPRVSKKETGHAANRQGNSKDAAGEA